MPTCKGYTQQNQPCKLPVKAPAEYCRHHNKPGVPPIVTINKQVVTPVVTETPLRPPAPRQPPNAPPRNQQDPALVTEIRRKFQLSALEEEVFTRYLRHIHKEDQLAFLQKVQERDREYLDQFLDTEFETLGNEIFPDEEDKPAERRKQTDLYQMRTLKDNLTQQILIYKAVLKRLGDLSPKDRKTAYTQFFRWKPNPTATKIERRVDFYSRFLSFIGKLSQPKFEQFVDDLFDWNLPAEQIFV